MIYKIFVKYMKKDTIQYKDTINYKFFVKGLRQFYGSFTDLFIA